MKIEDLARTIGNQKLDLLFLQNCNMGSVATLKALGNSAKYVLTSQHYLGAPNAYYEVLWELLRSPGFEFSIELLTNVIAVYDRHMLSLSLYDLQLFDRLVFDGLDLVLTKDITDVARELGLIYHDRPDRGVHLMDFADLAFILPIPVLLDALLRTGLALYPYAEIADENRRRKLLHQEIVDGLFFVVQRHLCRGNIPVFSKVRDNLERIPQHSGIALHLS